MPQTSNTRALPRQVRPNPAHPYLLRLCLLALSLGLMNCGGGSSRAATPPASGLVSSSASLASSASIVSSAASSSSHSSNSVATSSATTSSAAGIKALIKLNQVGYKPGAEKLAVIPEVAASRFSITKANSGELVLTGNLSAAQVWEPAQESVKLADFSALTQEGSYKLQVDGLEQTASFSISAQAYVALNAGALKAYYFNRASTDLLPAFAGLYQRAAGHGDTQVIVHPSAATALRPAGTFISAPKGWYDAGDYNLYSVNAGISTYTLLAAYEHYPSFFNAQNLNIPESGNALPDILNEALWNLEWMLAMQDPNDGGVYHKLTSKSFSGFILPADDHDPRYVVQKTTAASLDFAAVMAAASRIYAPYEASHPGLAAKMRSAAQAAYLWAQAHPRVVYVQPNDIYTGEYGDDVLSDEFAWAAAELYITTQEDAYYTALNPEDLPANVPSWGDVKSLAWISLAHNRNGLTARADKDLIKRKLDALALSLASLKPGSAYGVPLQSQDFTWGSNSQVLNIAMMLLVAYELDNSHGQYLTTAQSLLDYVLGRNPTDLSFVTGFGLRTPQHIHHRPSVADAVSGSIPGFLAGGANPGQQDLGYCSKAYPSLAPAKSYLDDVCSYASNEVTINWNAPLVYVSAALQVLTP